MKTRIAIAIVCSIAFALNFSVAKADSPKSKCDTLEDAKKMCADLEGKLNPVVINDDKGKGKDMEVMYNCYLPDGTAVFNLFSAPIENESLSTGEMMMYIAIPVVYVLAEAFEISACGGF
jgi:hypothetical protein